MCKGAHSAARPISSNKTGKMRACDRIAARAFQLLAVRAAYMELGMLPQLDFSSFELVPGAVNIPTAAPFLYADDEFFAFNRIEDQAWNCQFDNQQLDTAKFDAQYKRYQNIGQFYTTPTSSRVSWDTSSDNESTASVTSLGDISSDENSFSAPAPAPVTVSVSKASKRNRRRQKKKKAEALNKTPMFQLRIMSDLETVVPQASLANPSLQPSIRVLPPDLHQPNSGLYSNLNACSTFLAPPHFSSVSYGPLTYVH
mmetsp:Transcript_39278/g.77252  ORF Transcript_39278/g.77252 Transcript_39278/m.77252 type:complete len:256 (-) Transcript_39278:634-1401(-)|eukprot:CAMPEP_0175129046 /NCGR_PEP_ID=MMETSP0087-20121206/5258_1 /TAXON_ID=136419 /ORGANISM="Unknown Unknown, Strain D1" /LENGTH=255 /DNA_ID=CAMNT_0016411159 /DNA_START=115 /DNA_END=882 /DNA_ORIENTATION=-